MLKSLPYYHEFIVISSKIVGKMQKNCRKVFLLIGRISNCKNMFSFVFYDKSNFNFGVFLVILTLLRI